jgi:2-amino-4-hydroxy-6-hydroxymethyldihydropteridine diphosphokinase
MAEPAYIGIGSNLGDRQSYLEAGVAGVASLSGVKLEAVSSVYETAPVGMTDQPFFLNAVFAVRAVLSPLGLMRAMRRLEDRYQRQRQIHWGPRTLDLDLLLYGDLLIESRELVLPHPRMHERCFVLVPLCQIAPALRHPGTGRLFTTYLQELDCSRQTRCVGPLRYPQPSTAESPPCPDPLW